MYSAGVGHDDPTAVMGNVKHTQSQLSVGTISSFMTTEQDRDIEAREPHEGTDIINVNFIHDMENSDLREQLYELDQAANSWTSRHSQLSGDSSETERFYVSEAGNNGSPRLWQQRERKPLPETIEEQSEMSNGSEQDDGQDQNIAMEAAVAFSPCLGFEQEVVFEDTKGFGYISSDYSHGSNEQASTIQSVVSDVSQKECLEVNDDTGILSATSSNGSPSHMKEIVRQVQKLLLGSPAVEIGTDSNSIEIAKRPDPRPSTPSEQESSFENQVHIPFIFEQVSQDSENVEFIEAKSRARRRQFVCYSFLCLVMIGLVLALLFFLKEDRRFSHDRFIDSSAALATAEPSQYVDANPSSHPSFAPVENLTGNPTLPSGSTQSPPSREQTLMPSAMTTTMSDSNPTPPRLRVPTPEPSVAPVQVPSASGTSLTAAPITATIPLSNSDTENEAFDAKTHLLGISGDLLNDPTTSQYDAYQWLINEDPANLDIDSIPIKNLEQRYISTLLYFSTQGSMWDDTFNFLTEVDVCDWKDSFTGKGIMCDSQGTIEEITISESWSV